MKQLLTLFFIGLTSLYAQTVPSYVPTNGLVGWWPFNGNTNDESGNGLNGTGAGSPTLTQDRFSVASKAYSFDGIDDYISVTRNYQSAFSLSIWFNPSTSPQYNPLVDAFDANWEVQLKNTRPDFVSFITSTNYQEFISTQTTTNNNWYHLVCTYSSNTVTFYLNGNQTDQYTVNPLPNNNGNYYFGASLSGTDQFYNGKLDDIGIWNRALTQQEITNLYNSTLPCLPSYVPNSGLVGYWPFCGNANDESGNGNNGVGAGSPTLTQDRFGIASKAYSFDGIDDYISVTRNYQSAFSLSIWFNPSTSPQYNPLVDAFDANWEVQLKNTRPDFVSFITSTNYQEFISTQTTTNNNWYHLVCTYSSNTVTFYLNGNQTDQYTVNPLPNNNGNYYFGASLSGTDQFYNGKLDDIGIWNRALNPQEVLALHLGCLDSLQSQPQSFTAYSGTGWANFKCTSTDTAATYQWQQSSGAGWSNLSNLGNYSGANSDSLVITGVTATMNNYGYRCIVIGCNTDTSDVAVLTVANGIGLGESTLEKLTIFPNPTNGLVSLNAVVLGTYELLSLEGRILESGTAKKDYDFTTYPKGVYHLRLSTDEGTRVLKVVKN